MGKGRRRWQRCTAARAGRPKWNSKVGGNQTLIVRNCSPTATLMSPMPSKPSVAGSGIETGDETSCLVLRDEFSEIDCAEKNPCLEFVPLNGPGENTPGTSCRILAGKRSGVTRGAAIESARAAAGSVRYTINIR